VTLQLENALVAVASFVMGCGFACAAAQTTLMLMQDDSRQPNATSRRVNGKGSLSGLSIGGDT
jgi:hypothetical protein